MIAEETYKLLTQHYRGKLDDIIISDVCVGLRITAVILSDGSYGVAGTMDDQGTHCAKENRDFGAFTPSKIRGSSLSSLFSSAKSSNILMSLKIAVMNALSSRIISESGYKVIEDADPVDLIDLSGGKNITIVGAFHSYIRKISSTPNTLHVLELDREALADEHKKFYVPSSEYKTLVPRSDIVIITGLTLVNNTIDGLLEACNSRSKVIVTGPSSSLLPDLLFSKGVNMIGATRITDPDLLLTVAAEGGAGYHLFKYCARKICILNE